MTSISGLILTMKTHKIIKETTSNNKTSQEIYIHAFDIQHKQFGSGTGITRINFNIYELRTSPDNTAILKIIIYKASHPNNHFIIQFIPYGIQGITNKDIYRTIIIKQNAFIAASFIIRVYDTEERDVDKFKQPITNSTYTQDIEATHESKLKENYFLIATKTEYKKTLFEAKEVVKNIYPQRSNIDLNTARQSMITPIINTNVLIYAQALMQFLESNPVQDNSFQKRLKIQFNENSITTKRDATLDIPQTIHNQSETKSVTFIDDE